MVFRHLFNWLAGHPQVIEKLSESYPVRRAAQLVVYMYNRGRAIAPENLEQALKSGLAQQALERAKRFGTSFSEEFQKLSKDLKKPPKNL